MHVQKKEKIARCLLIPRNGTLSARGIFDEETVNKGVRYSSRYEEATIEGWILFFAKERGEGERMRGRGRR